MHLASKAGLTWDPFPPAPERADREARDRRDANRAIGVSALGLAVTGVVELAIAVMSGSVGLLGDALHNLSDVSTSIAVFVGLRFSKRPADASHPYGHERAEDLAGLVIAAVIWASAVFAAVASLRKLSEHGDTTHLGWGMAAAAVGIVGNQLVARYKATVGHRINSMTLLADAQHSWLDALSSAGALLGLTAVWAGLPWADAVAGLVVTAFIIHVGWEVTTDVAAHLMDRVAPEVLDRAQAAIGAQTEVLHGHVRGRWMGRSLILEIEGFIDAATPLGAAEHLGRCVERHVLDAVPEARAVLWIPRAMTTPTG